MVLRQVRGLAVVAAILFGATALTAPASAAEPAS